MRVDALTPRSSTATEPMRSPSAGIVNAFAVDTTAERFRPVISLEPRTSASWSSSVSSASDPEKIPARMAPLSLRRRVTARVSTPLIPTIFCSSSCESREPVARKFETILDGSRTTKPATQILCDSLSTSFTPVLPMCGAVMSTIWPAYEGSVMVS